MSIFATQNTNRKEKQRKVFDGFFEYSCYNQVIGVFFPPKPFILETESTWRFWSLSIEAVGNYFQRPTFSPKTKRALLLWREINWADLIFCTACTKKTLRLSSRNPAIKLELVREGRKFFPRNQKTFAYQQLTPAHFLSFNYFFGFFPGSKLIANILFSLFGFWVTTDVAEKKNSWFFFFRFRQ